MVVLLNFCCSFWCVWFGFVDVLLGWWLWLFVIGIKGWVSGLFSRFDAVVNTGGNGCNDLSFFFVFVWRGPMQMTRFGAISSATKDDWSDDRPPILAGSIESVSVCLVCVCCCFSQKQLIPVETGCRVKHSKEQVNKNLVKSLFSSLQITSRSSAPWWSAERFNTSDDHRR